MSNQLSLSTRETAGVNSRIISLIRLALALSATLLIATGSARTRPSALDVVLVVYIAYSAALYLLAAFNLVPFLFSHDYWADVVYCLLIILLTGGIGSPVLLFLLFPIHIASFRRGLSAGLQVTLTSIAALLIMAVTSPLGLTPTPRVAFVRLFGLFCIGALLASWGSHEFRLRHRLAVVREITKLSNPRFGVDALINSILRRLLALYSASRAMLLLSEPGSNSCHLYRIRADQVEKEAQAEAITPELQAKLFKLPETLAVVFGERTHFWWSPRRVYSAFDLGTNSSTTRFRSEARELSSILSSRTYLSVPVCFNDQVVGRLYLLADRPVFDSSDVEYVLQIIGQVIPVIENIRLVDRLASIAAEEERKKIARDIHDSVIQPYIGLQLGLTGVRRKLLTGEKDVTKDIDSLMEVISNEVVNLRSFVRGLKEAGDEPPDNLLPAVRRFAGKFSEATGIAVRVIANEDLSLNDRLAGEVFQMVVEGLSNIRRHTSSSRATIILARRDESLNLRIEDNGANGSGHDRFLPRSLAERARVLGGELKVKQQANITMVDINIRL